MLYAFASKRDELHKAGLPSPVSAARATGVFMSWLASGPRGAICFVLLALGAIFCSADASQAQTPNCPTTFKHPGILTTLDDLKAVKQHIARGDQPWKSAYDMMAGSPYASLGYVAHPFAVVSSGVYNANAHGTFEESKDEMAAYTQALMWIFTGDERYARNAASILDAWSSTLKTHEGQNWYLQASWAGSVMPLSAELLRATYPQWTAAEIAQFKTMLSTAFLPLLHDRMAYGNRELSVINALMAIGVFNDDPAAFCEGLTHWRSYVPDYIYLSSDGPEPKRPSYMSSSPSDDALMAMDGNKFAYGNWILAAQTVTMHGDDRTAINKWKVEQWWYRPDGPLVDGLCQETGRDLEHSELAMAAIFNAAQIAWNQGIDLFTPNAARLAAFLERSAGFRLGAPAPPGLYPQGIKTDNRIFQSYEIGFDHLRHENKIQLPLTQKLLVTVLRPVSAHYAPAPPGIVARGVTGPASIISVWQTLTNTRGG
jgi:hypothetical protein